MTFGGVRALDGVTMAIEDGVCCGIIGPNGSGKTTLLGAVTRLTKLSGGRIFFEEKEYSGLSPARTARLGIARTFQTVRLLPTLTVTKNVMVGAASAAGARRPIANVARLATAVSDNRKAQIGAEQALERVGMLDHGASLPQDLPYGLQRRVEIARALAAAPKLLLLDEPMAGMSGTERLNIAALLQELKQQGLTQVLVEHDLEMIHRVCDTCYALDFGRVIAEGPSYQVAAQPVVREAYLGLQAVAEEETMP